MPVQATLFEAAARAHPEDSDVHAALGVVYNLSRQFDEAVVAFRCGLSLWREPCELSALL